MKRIGFILLLAAEITFGQSSFEPLNRDFITAYDNYLNNINSGTHTCIKPYLSSELAPLNDSVKKFLEPPFLLKRDTSKINPDHSHLGISPLLVAEPGYSLNEHKSILLIEGGARLSGTYKSKLAWTLNALFGNSVFPNYIDSTIKYKGILPETGYAYKAGNSYSYQHYTGYLSYSPNRIFNFQLGKDKNFWGDGYRSLFLSDAASSYPFFKITAKVWHLKYAVLYAMQKDISANTGLRADEKTKYGVFHYLSWNVVPRLNLGLFESIVWQGNDTTRARGFDPNYLNPVIFFRPIEYSLGSSDNALLGGSFKVKVARRQQFYGQLILDEFFLKEILKLKGWWGNKQGIQLGFRDFDLFTIKNLNFTTELNCARPYTYSHGSVQQNYGHFDQPLAHPLGANFREGVGILSYRLKNFLIEVKGIYAVYGLDTAGLNYGLNIFESYITHPKEYHNYSGQGLRTYQKNAGLRIAYLLGGSSNMEIEAGVMLRSETNAVYTLNTTLVFVGLRTALWNSHRDY